MRSHHDEIVALLPRDAQDLWRWLAGGHFQTHVLEPVRLLFERLTEELLHFAHGVVHEVRRPGGQFSRLAEQRIVDRKQRQPGTEVSRNCARILERRARAFGKIEWTENRGSSHRLHISRDGRSAVQFRSPA